MKKFVIMCTLISLNSQGVFASPFSSMGCLPIAGKCKDMEQVQLADNLKQALTSQGQDMTSDVREAISSVRNNNEDLVKALIQAGHTELTATQLTNQLSQADDMTIIALLLELNK